MLLSHLVQTIVMHCLLLVLSGPQITAIKSWGDPACQTVAPRWWITLPSALRSADAVASFKRQLKPLLFRQVFG